MVRPTANDLDFLAAYLHGRRSRLAEAERLDALCRLRTIPELARTVYADAQFHAAADFQRRLVQDLVRELADLLGHLAGAGARLFAWMLVRFQVENLKVLVRGFATRTPLEVLQKYLVVLPKSLELDTPALASAESLEEFAKLLPTETLQESVEDAVEIYRDQPRPFFLEAALDRGYFLELLARANGLSGADRQVIKAMVLQEVDIFHLMLVVRGKFHYGLKAELLLPLHADGTGIPYARFASMLADPDLLTAASRSVGRVLDALPSEQASEALATVDPAALEALAWKRFLRLANRAFRRSHMDLGAVVGYAGIRRVEVANLISLSEAIRTGMAAEVIRARLIPRNDLESADV